MGRYDRGSPLVASEAIGRRGWVTMSCGGGVAMGRHLLGGGGGWVKKKRAGGRVCLSRLVVGGVCRVFACGFLLA